MYEKLDAPLISRRAFAARLIRHGAGALLVLLGSLAIGIAGYSALGNLGLVDAFLNAAMILGGMGPVDQLPNDGAKIFAGVYALYSGVVFLLTAGIVLAPILHRVMHYLHLEADKDDSA